MSLARVLVSAVPFLALTSACSGAAHGARAGRDPLDFRDGTAISADGTAIHYREGGRGDATLVFVHGWLGDVSVWDEEMRHFAPKSRVVALDLAGHGSSGRGRKDWTVENFAADVVAVVRALDLSHVVLLGHSMSGPITVAAANQLGDRVDLLVPVDTLQDVEWELPPEVWKQFFDGLRADFPNAVEGFFRGRLAAPGSPKEVIDAIVAKARAADPALAIPMLERGRDYDLKAGLRRLRVPIVAINSDVNPTRLDVNRKYAPLFQAELVPGVGHWPHLEAPERFDAALETVLASLW